MLAKKVTIWLYVCAIVVILMVVLGGLTRLTGSGLSMTKWKPITGWLPPTSDIAWQEEFNSYKETPQYKEQNSNIDLAGFKGIFWLEFFHRLLGRCAGLIFILPLFYFAYQKALSKKLVSIFSLIFFLGATQGVIGWYMVKSGLKDLPYVSNYMLSFHLLFACLILACILVAAFYSQGLKRSGLQNFSKTKKLARIILFFVVMQIGMGGLVAGIHAGLIYNTYPTMDGEYVPSSIMFNTPWYVNFINNPATVQFQHRMGAIIVFALSFVFLLIILLKRQKNMPKILIYGATALGFFVFLGFLLGVIVLLTHVLVPLALFHQLVAIIIFAIVVFINYIA